MPDSARTAAHTRARKETSANAAPLPPGLRLTHPERVVDASTGITKRDLVEHCVRAAPRMLPHLSGRPVAFLRAPEGLAGPQVFQKHAGTLRIRGLRQLDPALDPGHPPLVGIDSVTTLAGAAQFNVIEFHTWNARSARIEQPDRLTFDLDPGEGVAWSAMQDAAAQLRALLGDLGLVAWLKTSGGKGLHVVVPIGARHGWETVRALAQAVVQHLAETQPARFVAKSGPQNRIGRIFVDYLRNGRGATTVAPYSPRARPGMGVSIPCAWEELPRLTGGDHWTLATAHERLAGEDPWAGFTAMRQGLARALRRFAIATP